MGCFGNSKSKAMYIAEPNFGKKAQLMLTSAQKKERKTGCCGGAKTKHLKKSVKCYGTYNRCMAVHLFRETDHTNLQAMMSVCSNARTIVGHQKNIVARILMKSRKYKTPVIICPAMLSPVQWAAWVDMCSSSGPIEYYLRRMGLLRHMTVLDEHIAIANANKSAISITNNSTNTVAGPTTSIAGPNTNIAGPNTSTAVNPTITANPVNAAGPISESLNKDSVKGEPTMIPQQNPYFPQQFPQNPYFPQQFPQNPYFPQQFQQNPYFPQQFQQFPQQFQQQFPQQFQQNPQFQQQFQQPQPSAPKCSEEPPTKPSCV
ncbi:Fibernectin binding protein [Only Syngen Nebraska virus 5]|uniref:Fibernectin binding protein n=1 Tax=Only Syngen Nebraska virus 5 TaxID=1917232 RepID=UPI000900CDD2|nr:Fibernectin binding protein [Only Syngen Nebraska virus 5]APC25655.1 Fibernectin binding protein [Only Syngen Nebraska virus 5]